jgi:glycine hydroxymethyltransferase
MSTAPRLNDAHPDGFFADALDAADPVVSHAVRGELRRQQNQIELIASENIVSRAVLEAQGSVLTNKYAEGYPGRRYYQGCAPSDAVETLAIERAKQLFGCGFANVQPHSGAQANGAVMLALTKPGDTILGMSLDAGGPPHPRRQAGAQRQVVQRHQYGVRQEDHLVDFDQVEALAKEHRPTLLIAGGSAYPRHPRFRTLPGDCRTRSARPSWSTWRTFAGLVAAGEHPSPFGHAHVGHDHHAQDAARPARRHGADRRRGDRQEDQLGVFPGCRAGR